jgi:hypothetical protein
LWWGSVRVGIVVLLGTARMGIVMVGQSHGGIIVVGHSQNGRSFGWAQSGGGGGIVIMGHSQGGHNLTVQELAYNKLFMYLWPTYYTFEIRVYIPTLPLF